MFWIFFFFRTLAVSSVSDFVCVCGTSTTFVSKEKKEVSECNSHSTVRTMNAARHLVSGIRSVFFWVNFVPRFVPSESKALWGREFVCYQWEGRHENEDQRSRKAERVGGVSCKLKHKMRI